MKKALLFSTFLFCIGFAHAQDNPYAVFGYQPKTILKDDPEHLKVINKDTTSSFKSFTFDSQVGEILLYGKNGELLKTVKIGRNEMFRFISPDPLSEKYYSLNPYNYVGNNPINAIDPDGKRILFVNGFTYGDIKPQFNYWGQQFVNRAQSFFNDTKGNQFIDGQGAWNSSGGNRYDAGYLYAKENFKTLTEGLGKDETFKLVTHSQGGAYGSGISKYLIEQGLKVETVVHLSTHDPEGFNTPTEPTTYQLGYSGDHVVDLPSFGVNNIENTISGTDKFGVVNKFSGTYDRTMFSHGSTRNPEVFNELTDLSTVGFSQTNNSVSLPFFQFRGVSNTYNSTGTNNGTNFKIVETGGNRFNNTGGNTFQGPIR